MKYRRFGRTEWQVSEIGLGMWGLAGWTGSDDERSLASLTEAVRLGCTFFDTANAYVDGESERIVGKALKGRRDRAVLSSKVGMARVSGRVEGLSRRAIESAIDASLARLATDYLDVYYLHVPDHETPLEDDAHGFFRLLQLLRPQDFPEDMSIEARLADSHPLPGLFVG